jgi:hypothetical protein
MNENSNSKKDSQVLRRGVKSPSEFIELSTEQAEQQLTTLTEQIEELAALAQRVTLATAEPLKASLVPTST